MFYQLLDLPKVPEDILYGDPDQIIRTYESRSYLIDNQTHTSSHSVHYQVCAELGQWVKSNIVDTYNDIGIRHVYSNTQSTVIAPHTDQTRRYVLIYNLSTGGGEIVFWQQRGYNLNREGRVVVNNYSELDEQIRFKVPERQWYILNTQILHLSLIHI